MKLKTITVNAAEQEVVNCFRRLHSEHSKLAMLILLQGMTYGELTKAADKKPLRSLVRS